MKNTKRTRPHGRIYEDELELPAWLSISTDARALLIEIRARGRPDTNGAEVTPLREIKRRLGVGNHRAKTAFDELTDRGYLYITRKGGKGHSPEYRRTDSPAPRVGKSATEEFRRWKPSASKPAAGAGSGSGHAQPVIAGMSTASDGVADFVATKRKALANS